MTAHRVQIAARIGRVGLFALILLTMAELVRADSYLIGHLPDGVEDAALCPLMFVILDGEPAPSGASQKRMRVTPGLHSVAAVPAEIPGKVIYTPDLTEAKFFAIEVKACSDVFVAARFRSEAESDWEPEIVGEWPARKCENNLPEKDVSSPPDEGG